MNNSIILPSSSLTTKLFNTSNTTSFEGLTTKSGQRNDFLTLAGAISCCTIVGILFVFGIFANALTILVVKKSADLKTSAFNVIICSLAFSDFISAWNSPFAVYRSTFGYRLYYLPTFFCKTTMAFKFWTSCVTIQHILVFTILRIAAIKFPHRMKIFTVYKAKILVMVIWIETFLANFIFYFWFPYVYSADEFNPVGVGCSAHKDQMKYITIYTNIAFPIFLWSPILTVVLLTFVLICLVIQRKRLRQKDRGSDVDVSKENFALLQLSLILLSFLIGYLPDAGYRLAARIRFENGQKFVERQTWILKLSSLLCLRISECLNPIFYNIASSTMRKATKTYVTTKLCFKQTKQDNNTTNADAPPRSTNKQV
uniref:probable G-protein coupled receptor 19 n=1 Tax=Styela clava TaxID=7725 RepID=UPI00193A11D2|nr:probable G-protein coupled receptor 19 [Styela clava]